MINAYQQYQQNYILSAPPEKLVVMLCEGALKFARLAKKAIEEKNYAEANNYLIRTQDIIMELNASLDMEYEISKNLRSLYNFIYQRLIEANLKKDGGVVEEIEPLLEDLKDTWQRVYIEVSGLGKNGK
ncbi:flagellar export chaperone FliS [Thermosediminibacter oceani]|uniref:Flagellar secretion chaperone FliS n=1 Tax=Thermosediminibacter oceani (strain ATCC BAA-1034 / DSM 16646 / JW/IW-1228P) TaxID=555079 RepID=D9RY96_THEOJ|nr:flagellar export chaperone FliS [Thermosediminibacter oceani]ADL08320.1 flagellar protein FliS [Thermosediminibacter oceani DSM 16646]